LNLDHIHGYSGAPHLMLAPELFSNIVMHRTLNRLTSKVPLHGGGGHPLGEGKLEYLHGCCCSLLIDQLKWP
jgi:hypothetical protein